MKYADINRRFTEIVAEWLAKGYSINTASMSGSQGETAKIDLTDGKEIVRILVLPALVLLLGKPSIDEPADSRFRLAPLGIVGAPARHFPKLLHDIDGWVQLAPAVVILRRHIKERLVIQNDADDRRRGDGFRLCASILRILYICLFI